MAPFIGLGKNAKPVRLCPSAHATGDRREAGLPVFGSEPVRAEAGVGIRD